MAEPAAVLELPRRRSPAVAALVAHAAAPVDEEPPALRGHRLRREARRPDALGRSRRGVRRVLRGVERRVPRERRPRCRLRPAPSRQALPADRPRRARAAGGARARRVLVVVALVLAGALGPASLACLVAFVGLQAAYSLGSRPFELVDVLAIAGLFVLRAAAGAIAVDVRISEWLLLCTFLLALFVALGKRRAELGLDGVHARPSLSGYSVAARRPAARDRRGGDDRRLHRVRAGGARHALARRDRPARRLRALPVPAAAPPARPRRGARRRSSSRTCRCSSRSPSGRPPAP